MRKTTCFKEMLKYLIMGIYKTKKYAPQHLTFYIFIFH